MTLLKRLKKIMKGSAKKSKPRPKQKSAKKTASKSSTKLHSTSKKSVKKAVVKKVAIKKSSKSKPVKKAVKHAKKPVKNAPQKKSRREARKAIDQLAQTLAQTVVEKKVVKPYPVITGGNSARVAMLVPILRDLVKKGVISDWIINLHYKRGASTYCEKQFIVENTQSTVREDVHVRIYERFSDGTMGETQIPIVTTDPAEARKILLDAKESCQYTKKPEFSLPEPVEGLIFPQSFDEKMLNAIFDGNNMQIANHILQEARGIVAGLQEVKVNAAEVITCAETCRVLNSNGVDVSYHRTSIYLEFTMTCKTKNEEREFLVSRHVVSPDQLDLQSLLLQQAQIARDASIAQPNPGFIGDVLIAGQSVTEVFAPHLDANPLVVHTSARIAYMGIANLKLMQPIGHFVGDHIIIATNPALALGLLSAPVDEEGTPLKPVELIRNGTFTNYLATSRYAQYLQVPATGGLSNIQISPGAIREQHLRGNNYLEIVSFSWFNPDTFSGDFSAEIRLAYHWVNGRKTAYRGGTFTGNMFKNILHVRFSKETMQSAQYFGPRAILFKNSTVTKFS